MDLFLGIDGGGTKTAAVIIDSSGQVRGAGEGGPSTYGVVPEEVTRRSIQTAVAQARAAGQLGGAPFRAAFLGLGNVVSELDRSAVRAIAVQQGLSSWETTGVDHDCRIALAGGLSGRAGIVLIAGTGTSCFGRNTAGQGWRSGGWGPLIDDEGSSYWLGIQAMRAAILDFDGRGAITMLTQAVIDQLRLQDMNEIMNRLYASEMSRTEIAALAPLVFAAAAQGDAPAIRLIRQGAEAMADCVLAVAQRLGMQGQPGELAVVGGLTNAGQAFLHPLATSVAARLPLFRVLLPELPPAAGAALLAMQIAGCVLHSTLLARIHESTQWQKVTE